MKLRNKKTGEVIEVKRINFELDDTYAPFSSLRIVNEFWEDYIQKEPLIKDEKVRKVVRAWADANDIERVWHECASSWLRGNGLQIEMENGIVDLEQGNYSIAELCGEEE